jgi:hypothetical protein
MNLILFAALALILVLLEWVMWRTFRNKIAGVLFPHEADHSSLSFFTMGRIRVCAIVHTVFLLLCLLGLDLLFFPAV